MRRKKPDVILPAISVWRARARNALVSAAMTFLLCGCIGTSVDPTAASNRPLSAEDESRLEPLLMSAENALANDLLDLSKPHSATYLFQQVLSQDPTNAEAKRGLEQIVERYVALALTAAEQGDTNLARDLLARSRLIDPAHPSVRPTSEFINTIDTSQRESVIIRELSASALSDAIDDLVRDAGSSCRFRISAANDERARALYQLLRQGFVRNQINRRPRAATKISTPDRLERICPL